MVSLEEGRRRLGDIFGQVPVVSRRMQYELQAEALAILREHTSLCQDTHALANLIRHGANLDAAREVYQLWPGGISQTIGNNDRRLPLHWACEHLEILGEYVEEICK